MSSVRRCVKFHYLFFYATVELKEVFWGENFLLVPDSERFVRVLKGETLEVVIFFVFLKTNLEIDC